MNTFLLNKFSRNGNTILVFETTENGVTAYMVESDGLCNGKYFIAYDIENYFTALRIAVKKLKEDKN
jgi:hypothetical protein